ncbi:MAG: hypothetical protein AOA65_1635 [Candidatus Bathyarchaeota archaeon BA1]|nr:MAG: hypothetical protein AOA65_1635 [Candidatus Bathyarchaeota archaeon BA1]
MRKTLLIFIILLVLAISFLSYQQFFTQPPIQYPPGMSTIDKAALKAERIQAKELQGVIEALKQNDHGKIIYGDRFLRWTVLAYTLWKIDQGDPTIIKTMQDLMTTYYQRAWYPYVKNRPPMPFPSLIQHLRADGTWEDYWCDYKPVYVAAYMLEYYVLTCFDQAWGIKNYPILKNVADSLLQMWLPNRHQPTAYIDAQGKPGAIQITEIMNIACSVDSAMIYSALISSAQIARLANDPQSQENYMKYADDLITHFYSQTWEWFPTNTFGSNPSEPTYGTALQIGMTLPYIDGDKKIDALKDYLVNNLRVSENSWLLKWSKNQKEVSSRSVFAAIGLAPKYPQLAYNILNAYAEAALSNDPWFLSANWKIDGYEGVDPIWVSGKYLQAYVFMKNRLLTGRIPFSPSLMMGSHTFETSLPSDPAEPSLIHSTLPMLSGVMQVKANTTENALSYMVSGAPKQNLTIRFHTPFKPSVSCTASRWGHVYDSNSRHTAIWLIPNGDVEITIRKEG